MLKDFKPRLYQQTIVGTAVNKNTLVVLPTGLGKTGIALMLAAHRLKQYPSSKILITSPTKPLCDQHVSTFKKHLDIDPEKIVLMSGYIKPDKRAELWKSSKVVIATPQTLSNDVINKKINLEEASLLVLDEVQHCTGNYDYVFLAKQYNKLAKYPKIIGLTASPGSDVEKIEEICKNSFVEEIEVRTVEDPDVKPYINEVEVEYVEVKLPKEFDEVGELLKDNLTKKLNMVKHYGYITHVVGVKKTDLLALQRQLHGEIVKGNKDFEILKSVSLLAEALKVEHALELLETQGISALHNYMKKLIEQSKTTTVKAVKNLVADLDFRTALIKTESMNINNVEHPKLDKIKDHINEALDNDKNMKTIVFNQYRDNAVKLVEELNKVKGVKASIFVGQQKRAGSGMSQKEQKEVLDRFRAGEFNVLVSTSIGEEGLDIPNVDLVIFYEAIPSAIRQIQRRGRTGRHNKGKVVVLIAKNTRDVAYRWVAHHKEGKMHRTIKNLKNKLVSVKPQQKKIDDFSEYKDLMIITDYREKASHTVKELVDKGVDVKLKMLDTADYILSQDTAVEIKKTQDFVNSIIDGRLLVQLKDLKQKYDKPLVILEGEEDIYSVRQIHPNAIRGMLATIAVSYGIPILQTKNSRDTAMLLMIIAKREQEHGDKKFNVHSSKKPTTLKEQQEYIISALPGIGPSLAKPLLKEFKSVKNIMDADQKDLKKIKLIGDKKADSIRWALDSEYND